MGTTSKEKEKKNLKKQMKESQTEDFEKKIIFFSFFFLLVLSQIPEFLTVRIHRDKHEKCSTRRGLRVSTKNTGFHREFR